MFNKKMAVSALALTLTAGSVSAEGVGSSAFSAGVALLSPEQTGFRYAAQVGVEGTGSGAVSISTTAARNQFAGFAGAGAGIPDGGDTTVAATNAGVLGAFDFARTVETNGSLASRGNVFATGDAIGASGFSGAAFGDAEAAGVTAGDPFTAASTIESEGGLAGSVRTRNTLNLRGQEDNFAGSLGTSVGGRDTGVTFSALGVQSGAGIEIGTVQFENIDQARTAFFGAPAGDETPAIAPSDGVAFDVASTLNNDGINLVIGSAGGGVQSLDVETGGFFTGGAAAFGENAFGFAEAAEEPDN